jgi:hypothetical protein
MRSRQDGGNIRFVIPLLRHSHHNNMKKPPEMGGFGKQLNKRD